MRIAQKSRSGSPSAIVATPSTTTKWNGGRSSSMQRLTRPSRARFLPFTESLAVVKTNVSPSMWYQTGAACGRPSARTVASVAVLTLPSRNSRYSSVVISRAMRILPWSWGRILSASAPDYVPGSPAEHARQQVLEEEALDELAAASHAGLLEGVLYVPLDRVLGDEELCRDLARGQPARDETDNLLLTRSEAVGGEVEPGYVLGPRRLDNDHRLAGAAVGRFRARGVERDPAPRPPANPDPREQVVVALGGRVQGSLQRAGDHPYGYRGRPAPPGGVKVRKVGQPPLGRGGDGGYRAVVAEVDHAGDPRVGPPGLRPGAERRRLEAGADVGGQPADEGDLAFRKVGDVGAPDQVHPAPRAPVGEDAAELVGEPPGLEDLAVAQAAVEPPAGGAREELHRPALADHRTGLAEVLLEKDVVEKGCLVAATPLVHPFGHAVGYQAARGVESGGAVGVEGDGPPEAPRRPTQQLGPVETSRRDPPYLR